MKTFRQYYKSLEEYLEKIISDQLADREIKLSEIINKTTKMSFIFIPIIIGIIIAVLYLSFYFQYNSLKSNMFSMIEVGFSENLKSAMNTNDFLQVRNSLDKIRSIDAVESVILVDRNKKIIINDDLKNEGSYLDIPSLDAAFNETSISNPVKTNKSLVLVFKNEQSCQRCHLGDDQILGGMVVQFNSFDWINRTFFYFLFITIILLILIFVFKVFFTTVSESYLNTPIKTLMKVSKNISKGEVITSERIKYPIEFNYIYSVLSKMSLEIDDYIQEIKKKNSEKERIKMLAGIGEMAAKVAHEVRNPLNTIDGAIHYIRKKNSNNDDYREYLDLIEENIQRINNVASELLDATRPSKPVLEKVNPVKLLRERIQEFSESIISRQIEVNFEATGEIPIIFVDKYQITQVIDNLLENSINALDEKEKGVIKIHLKKISPTPMHNFLILRFFDNGCGISKENLHKIFVPFFTTKSSGSGLGLSIVEKIITNHRGEIKVLSKETKRTLIRIKLPVRT